MGGSWWWYSVVAGSLGAMSVEWKDVNLPRGKIQISSRYKPGKQAAHTGRRVDGRFGRHYWDV
jgi:hypothetical protein